MKKVLDPVLLKGGDGTCPVVRIKSDNEAGFRLINEHDFDEEQHELFVEGGAPSKTPADMSQKELSAHLTSLNIEHNPKAKKADLLALVPAAD